MEFLLEGFNTTEMERSKLKQDFISSAWVSVE